jgi:PAS domain S-box-containing protein
MTSLESIFNNIDEGLIILTPTGDQVYFNEGAFQMFQKIGVTLRESENIYQVLPGESAERMTRIIADVIEKKETVRSGSNQLGLDGTPLYLDEIYVPSFDDNTITHVNLLLRDNTEAKIYEKKIIGMATELHNLIDHANAVIIGTDTQGYITDWNNHTATLTSYSKNEALTNKCATLLMAAPDQPFFEDLIKRTLNGESIVNVEVPIISKAGNKLTFLLSTTARFNLHNEIIGVVFVGQDISLRLRIEREFKFAHDRLRFHLENSPLGFIEWDNQLKPKSWTQTVEEIFGWTHQEFLDSNMNGLSQVYQEDAHWVKEVADDLLSGKINKNHIQHRNITKDGRVIWCEWFNSVLKDEDGKAITIMSLVQDITERKSNELNLQEALLELEAYKESLEIKVKERTEELMEALKKEKDVVEMKSRFVSIASHEFRTPLSSIQHTANFIRKSKTWSADSELKEKLKDIDKQTKHMMYLLDDVLT